MMLPLSAPSSAAGIPATILQLGAVDHDADGEPDASGARVGIGVPVAGELGQGEQGQDDAAELEGHELAVVQDLRPAERAVEVPQRGEITRTKSDQVRQCADVFMALNIRRTSDNRAGTGRARCRVLAGAYVAGCFGQVWARRARSSSSRSNRGWSSRKGMDPTPPYQDGVALGHVDRTCSAMEGSTTASRAPWVTSTGTVRPASTSSELICRASRAARTSGGTIMFVARAESQSSASIGSTVQACSRRRMAAVLIVGSGAQASAALSRSPGPMWSKPSLRIVAAPT